MPRNREKSPVISKTLLKFFIPLTRNARQISGRTALRQAPCQEVSRKTDNRAVNKRHEQRSEADTDKFSEKQQRHRTANGKTRQIKASLEKRPV